MMRPTASIGRCLGLLTLVLIGFGGCDRPDAPACLMRAGDWTEIVEEYAAAPRGLKLHDHMHVVLETWDSNATELVWRGPENVLAHRWSRWEGDVLELGHEDRCQWMRDLGTIVELTIRTPVIAEIALHGQGRLDASWSDSTAAVAIDTYAYAGFVELDGELDSLTIRLHSGACIARAKGTVQTLALYASGLSGVNAEAVLAERVFINQSAHPPFRFQATQYAYVALNSHGNVVGRLPEPMEYQVIRNGSGDLIWED